MVGSIAFADNKSVGMRTNNGAARRPDPDRLLRQIQAEEECQRRGRLKVFLGYASGVGKSFRMLDEGRRRRERGEDIVVGAIQNKASSEVDALLDRLEVIPLIDTGAGRVMDLPAILLRRPAVCLVDGLAYDNPPGWRTASRWQDVEYLLSRGISVVTSVNLQFIEERREQVEAITGKHVIETVPRSFLNTADEIEVVDAPPGVAANRRDESDLESAALRQHRLSELREIALLLAADIVDRQLESYIERNGIEQLWGAQERILICISSRSSAARMIESGHRNAQRFHGELFVAYVNQPNLAPGDQQTLRRNFSLAQSAGAHLEILDGE
ncbi:MAG: sensor histidine kinase KdpD, partial [Pseudomonadota bacterium]